MYLMRGLVRLCRAEMLANVQSELTIPHFLTIPTAPHPTHWRFAGAFGCIGYACIIPAGVEISVSAFSTPTIY